MDIDTVSDMPFVIKAIKLKHSTNFIDLDKSYCQIPFWKTTNEKHIIVCNEYNGNSEYDMYCKVEKHMRISEDLYCINKQTKHIMKDLINCKGTSAKNIITFLRDIANDTRVSTDLYTKLINILDETLFNECGDIEAFFVGDVSYNLEALYYQQDTWVDEISLCDIKGFAFDKCNTFSMDEGMYMLMFLGKWKSIIQQVTEVSDNPKIHSICNKYLQKVCGCTEFVITSIEEEDDGVHQLMTSFICNKKT